MTCLRKAFLLVCLVKLQNLQLTWSKGKPLNASSEDIENAFSKAYDDAQRLMDLESNLPNIGGILPSDLDSPETRHYGTGGDDVTLAVNANQYLFQQATKAMKEKFGLSSDKVRTKLPYVDLSKGGRKTRAALAACRSLFKGEPCDPTIRYRRASGNCNNLDNPTWGMSNTCVDRILPAFYHDGVNSPRKSASREDLPNARIISTKVLNDVDLPSRDITLMVMQWGQFIDHDITLSAMTRTTESGDLINCCAPGNKHPDCFPIQIPKDDEFFGPLGKPCINFVRSAACDLDCTLGPRSPGNLLTAFVDGSNIYGHDIEQTKKLRTFTGGRLRDIVINGDYAVLPLSQTDYKCTLGIRPHRCFVSGDERVDEQSALTSMHTVWLRQHNRIAQELRDSGLSDEIIFQTARRIVGAQMQHITFTEFLPMVIGDAARGKYKLFSAAPGRTVYDPFTRPIILAEFSTAAYRFGHTLIQNKMPLADTPGHYGQGELDFSESYFDVWPVLRGEVGGIVGGLASCPAQKYDRHIVTAVTNYLYRVTGEPSGLDLIALNIQRGRDHGLQSYHHYLKKCTGKSLKSFGDLVGIMEEETVARLAFTYKSFYDIDLFVGGVSEIPVDDAVVGPTFACIIGQQFNRLRYGDRFYYEHNENNRAVAFTSAQLKEIRKTTLAKVLCGNAGLDYIPANVFRQGSKIVDCESLPSLDFSVFFDDMEDIYPID